MRALFIHGIGPHPAGGPWEAQWVQAASQGILAGRRLVPSFHRYRATLDREDLSVVDVVGALANLIGSGLSHGLQRQATRGAVDDYPAVVLRWAASQPLQEELRARLLAEIQAFRPEVILGHSFGSLLAYDTLLHAGALPDGLTFVSFGSQIGSPFLRKLFGGVIAHPKRLSRWVHLHNPDDKVFTADLSVPDARYSRVVTRFPHGVLDHEATGYLGHAATVPLLRARTRGARRSPAAAVRPPRKRALIVGINDYVDPALCLEGCANDAYFASATLQERGFDAADIRLVLDRRATASAIRERLTWLTEDARPDDQLVFYFSGHGAQIPLYNDATEVDRLDETLVPADFDWGDTATMLRDDDLAEHFSQLPYGVQLLVVLDCCHAGGATRGARVRGLRAPDDIRHRALRWDKGAGMWTARSGGPEGRAPGLPRRPLGSADGLRPRREHFGRMRDLAGHKGPFAPLVLAAAGEDELASEYVHGATTYGAFTFALCTRLRRDEETTWEGLVANVREDLLRLGYSQRPRVFGPTDLLGARVLPTVESKRTRGKKVPEGERGLLFGPKGWGDERPLGRTADRPSDVRATLRDRWNLAYADAWAPTNLQELVGHLARAWAGGRPVKVVGAARSMSDVSAPGAAQVLTLLNLAAVRKFQGDGGWGNPPRTQRFSNLKKLVRCGAGMRVSRVLGHLFGNRQTLANHGSGCFQGIVGAMSTGTHGSGRDLMAVCGYARAMVVVRPKVGGGPLEPEAVLLMPADTRRPFDLAHGSTVAIDGVGVRVVVDTDEFDSTTVGLGLMGVIAEIVFEVEPERIHLGEWRRLERWSAATSAGLLADIGDRHVEVQILPAPGVGGKDDPVPRVGENEHLVQVTRRRVLAEKPAGNKSFGIRVGSGPMAENQIASRVRGAMTDPADYAESALCGLRLTSEKDGKDGRPDFVDYLSEVLLVDLQYAGTGMEVSVPLNRASAAIEIILGHARKAYRRAVKLREEGGDEDALLAYWRETPLLTALVSVRFAAGDPAWLSMMHGTEPRCSLEVGFLQDGELDLELRRREPKNRTERAYVAYRQGVTAWVPGLQRELEALGGRPHWGLAHSLSKERARALWPRFADWEARMLAMRGHIAFGGPFTERMGWTD